MGLWASGGEGSFPRGTPPLRAPTLRTIASEARASAKSRSSASALDGVIV